MCLFTTWLLLLLAVCCVPGTHQGMVRLSHAETVTLIGTNWAGCKATTLVDTSAPPVSI